MKIYGIYLIVFSFLRINIAQGQLTDDEQMESKGEGQFVATNLYFQYDTIEESSQLIHILFNDSDDLIFMVDQDEMKEMIGYWLFLNDQLLWSQQLKVSIYESIYIVFNDTELYFIWYSDFKLCFKQVIHRQNNYIKIRYNIYMNKYKFLINEICDIDNYQTYLESQLNHFFVQFNYLINRLESVSFNTNYLYLQFWIRNKQKNQNQFSLLIQNSYHYIYFSVSNSQIFMEIFQSHKLNYTDTISSQWNLISIEFLFDQNKGTYMRMSNNQVSCTFNFSVFQIQSQNLSFLEILKQKDVEFTGIQIHLKQKQFQIICIPGCNECDESGLCLKCNTDLILQDGTCECDQTLDYYFEYSECYSKRLYQIIGLPKNNCPTFNGQRCPQCEYSIDYQYCIYEIESKFEFKFQSDVSFQEQNNQIIIFKHRNNIDDFIELKQYKFKLYTLYRNSKYYNIFANQGYKYNCYINYFGIFCENKKIKKCSQQQTRNSCEKCGQKYYLNQFLKCSRCPQNCVKCTYIYKQMICLKCDKQYYLNFQGQCNQCEPQYCKTCYQYYQDESTLQNNYILKKSQQIQIGCSVCQQNYILQLELRQCVNDSNNYQVLEIYQRKYFYNSQKQLKLNQCDKLIDDCLVCQNDKCFLCRQSFVLDANSCLQIEDTQNSIVR